MASTRHHVILGAVIAGAGAISISGLVDNGTWQKIANEGQTFAVPSASVVRIGKGASWVERTVAGSGTCTLDFFGIDLVTVKDPAPGQTKICARKSGPPLPVPDPVDETPTDHHAGLAINQASIAAANASAQPGIDHELFSATSIPRSALEDGPIDYNVVGGPPTGNWEQWGDFRTLCNYTHYGYNDPIVMPGQKDKSHLHIFFGNTAVDELTTSENIRTRNSPKASCRGGTMNLTGYWTPAVLDRDTKNIVPPTSILIYYKTALWVYMDGNPPIEDLPHGLKMVVGSAVSAEPQPQNVSSFACMAFVGGGRVNLQNTEFDHFPTTCQPGDQVWWAVHFRQCWNGEIDSSNHKSHLADAIRVPSPKWQGRAYGCPSTHPLIIVQIAQILFYEVTAGAGGNPARWALASDVYLNDNPSMPAGYSAHADWMNGWDPVWSDRWSQKCSRERRNCGSWNDGDGRNALEFQGN